MGVRLWWLAIRRLDQGYQQDHDPQRNTGLTKFMTEHLEQSMEDYNDEEIGSIVYCSWGDFG